MEHKLIKTDNYLLVGADDDLKRGWFYCVRTKSIFQDEGEDIHCCIGDIRIIAHLPLNNSPYLDGIDVLPPLKDEVDNLANEFVKEVQVASDSINRSIKLGYEEGYNKAKEKYKYTEEDIAKAVMFGRWGATDKIAYNNFIQSLNQPTLPIAFECKIDNILSYNADDGIDALVNPNFGEPKTITNSQGLTEWVGEYKF